MLSWILWIIRIVYKKTDKWQRVITSGATSDNEWQGMTTSDNEWYSEWQRMTKNDTEWQGMTTSGTMSDNEWQPVTISANFSFFFQIREEPKTKHPKRNSLNLEEDLSRRPVELRAETSTQEEILTVGSRNCRSSYS